MFEIWRQVLNFSKQVNALSEGQYLFYNQGKSTFMFSKVCCCLGICCCCHNLTFLKHGLYHKETLLVTETINFTTGSLAFQNKHLNGVHFTSDIKRPYMGFANTMFS